MRKDAEVKGLIERQLGIRVGAIPELELEGYADFLGPYDVAAMKKVKPAALSLSRECFFCGFAVNDLRVQLLVLPHLFAASVLRDVEPDSKTLDGIAGVLFPVVGLEFSKARVVVGQLVEWPQGVPKNQRPLEVCYVFDNGTTVTVGARVVDRVGRWGLDPTDRWEGYVIQFLIPRRQG